MTIEIPAQWVVNLAGFAFGFCAYWLVLRPVLKRIDRWIELGAKWAERKARGSQDRGA